MKKLERTGIVFFLVLTLCLSVCPAIGVQASTLSGDMVDNFELNDIAYYNASGERVYKIEAGDITCKVNVLNNSDASKTLMLISAVYDPAGEILTMKTAGVGKATVAARTRADISVTVSVDSATGRVIKTFIWDTANRTPYKEVASLSELSGKKFDKAFLYYCRVLRGNTATSNKSDSRRSYAGVVDEHKGTITFEIPYSRRDASRITNTEQLKFAGFYFSGTENTSITWDRDTKFEAWIPETEKKPICENAENGTMLGKENFSKTNSVDLSASRPTFTFTAEDGSQASYKVNILFLVVDDDFESTTTADNGVVTSTMSKKAEDKEYASAKWYWHPVLNDTTGFVGAAEDADGNSYLTASRANVTSNVRNQFFIRGDVPAALSDTNSKLTDEDGTLVPLHNNSDALANVNVLVEYDWRYRSVDKGTTLNGIRIMLRNDSNAPLAQMHSTADKKMKWHYGTEEPFTYNPDTWHHTRAILVGLDNKKALPTAEGYGFRVYENEFAWDKQTALYSASSNRDMRIANIMFETSNAAGYMSPVDLDNLKIGLLYE